ncbi:BnaC01g00500D [Brassica napus]|uniref:(rape) hypothetical protein n=1 Tax=Brassica napus TaxID=3708 RepID=A0A078I0N7_BRANA|nr:unnamed protein product [Brassica napus]CDY42638.1 BnaC01g00500D [Brassica napus]
MYMVWLVTLVILLFAASSDTVLARLPCDPSKTIGGVWNKKLNREMKIGVGGSSSRPAGQGRARGRGSHP